MMDELWFSKLNAILFTHFQARVKSILPRKKIYFTTESNVAEPTKFPTVHFEELTPVERGNTLDNTSVNALIDTFQVTVYTQNRGDVKTVMDACCLAMKQLRFNITSFPLYDTNHDIKFGVARFRRLVGESDSF